MTVSTGTANNHNDLLDKLRTFCLAEGWTINNYVPQTAAEAVAQLDMTGPGSPGGQQPNVSILTAFDLSLASYTWQLACYQTYDSTKAFGNQVNNSPMPYFLLWQNAIDYWFYVNARRIIVVAKIGTYYMSMYAGFFLPYALPDEYPFPYCVGGTYLNPRVYTLANAGVRAFYDPGQSALAILERRSMTWNLGGNHFNTASATEDNGSTNLATWPLQSLATDGDSATDFCNYIFQQARPLLTGNMPVWQVQLLSRTGATVAGMLDGVYATGGFNRSAEQVLTIGGKDYRLFINVNRSAPRNFFALEDS